MSIYIEWLIIVAFVYFCYTRANVRPLGCIAIVLISVNLLYTRFATGLWGDTESSFAYMLMIGVACLLGHLNHQREIKSQ
jgi:hypothetical protein